MIAGVASTNLDGLLTEPRSYLRVRVSHSLTELIDSRLLFGVSRLQFSAGMNIDLRRRGPFNRLLRLGHIAHRAMCNQEQLVPLHRYLTTRPEIPCSRQNTATHNHR